MQTIPTCLSTDSHDTMNRTRTNTCLVLRYCRVAKLCHDPLGLAVEPYNFESQMEYLAQSCNVISLSDVDKHLNTRDPFKHNTVAVTFDCGYADILHVAKPVLERFSIPATAFVPTANIIERRPLWWDELEDLVIVERTRCELEIEIDDDECYYWPLQRQCDRYFAYESLYSILKDTSPLIQRRILGDIMSRLGSVTGEFDYHTPLDFQQLKEFEQGGLMAVGGSTHNCVRLGSLSESDQAYKIAMNKQALEEMLGHCVLHFGYPFVDDDDRSQSTREVVKDAGYSLAFGNSYGALNATEAVECYDLPRIKVGNWGAFAFHEFLTRFLD